ncbi:MAG TPA: hypothetical protein VIQ30_20195, partial [Pseudonocardia sp.]
GRSDAAAREPQPPATPNGRPLTGEVKQPAAESTTAVVEQATPAQMQTPAAPGTSDRPDSPVATEPAVSGAAPAGDATTDSPVGEVGGSTRPAPSGGHGSGQNEDPPTEQLVPTKRAVPVGEPSDQPERVSGEVRRTAPSRVTGAVPTRPPAQVDLPEEDQAGTDQAGTDQAGQGQDTPVPDQAGKAADEPEYPVLAGATGSGAGRPVRRRRRVASRPAGPPVGEDPV